MYWSRWHMHFGQLNRPFYTPTLLHTDPFITHKLLYTRTIFHTDTLMQRRFYATTLLHIDPFTHRRFYTQTLLRKNAFTHRSFCTQKLFTRRRFCTFGCLHPWLRATLFTHNSHTKVSAQDRIWMNMESHQW